MDRHKELFKDNWAIQSPQNLRVANRMLQQVNRAERRKNAYHQARNLPSTPGNDAFHFMAAASSTPMTKNTEHMEIESDKENCNNGREPPILNKRSEKKQERREAHIQKFLAWKAQKIQQKELEKQKYKPPFISVGKPKPKPNTQASVEQSSFAPKKHVFRPPAGLKDPTLEAVKRQSIYLPVPTPPKIKQKESNQIGKSKFCLNSKSARNIMTKKNIGICKSLKTPQRTEQTSGSNTKESASVSTVKITNTSASSQFGKKIDSNINNQQKTESSKCNPYRNEQLDTASKKAIQNPVPPVPFQKENAINKGISACNMDSIKKPLKLEFKINKAGLQTGPVSSVSKGTLKTTTTGAVGKAKAIQERKQNNDVLPKKQGQRNYPKAKLSTNLKAKKPANDGTKLTKFKCFNEINSKSVPTETPVDSGHSENVGFVTSTQMKTTSTSTLQNSKLSNLCKSISPVEVPAKNNAVHSVSAKRCLLQEPVKGKMTAKPRNFNFVKKVLLDVTSNDSPAIVPTNKEAFIKQNKEETEDKKQNKPNTQEQPTQNGKNKSKLHTHIYEKMQHLDKNVTNLNSPTKIKSTPRRSLKKESTNTQRTPQRNKKFNFLVNLKLDETVVESNDAANALLIEKKVNNESKQESNTPETAAPATLDAEEQPDTPKGVESNNICPLNYMSPFVSVSRGKVSARTEKEKRNSIYLQETPTKITTPIKTVETPVEKRRILEAVRYFRQQLNDEIQRLNAICNQWDAYKEENLPLLQENSAEDMINVATGQTRLLTTKKFMQFNGLINRCEAYANGTALADDGSEATKMITAEDLEGFWSMLTLQVENVEKRFQNLERFKKSNWNDPDVVELKPHIRNNLKKIKKSKTTMASTNGTSKPRENSALRQMMRKNKAEMRAKKDEDVCNIESEEIQVFIKEKILTPSPRRLRRSTLGNDIKRNSSSPAHICVVVPDRKSRSLARTVISVPSPVRYSSKDTIQKESTNQVYNICENDNLLRTTLRRCARRSRSLQLQNNVKTPSPIKSEAINLLPLTPKITPTICNGIKSVLKTPGTAKSQSRSVVFNNHLSVRRFRPLEYDDNGIVDVEYDAVQQVHINDRATIQQSDAGEVAERSYRLRNRRIKLRPSCEIEIPK